MNCTVPVCPNLCLTLPVVCPKSTLHTLTMKCTVNYTEHMWLVVSYYTSCSWQFCTNTEWHEDINREYDDIILFDAKNVQKVRRKQCISLTLFQFWSHGMLGFLSESGWSLHLSLHSLQFNSKAREPLHILVKAMLSDHHWKEAVVECVARQPTETQRSYRKRSLFSNFGYWILVLLSSKFQLRRKKPSFQKFELFLL